MSPATDGLLAATLRRTASFTGLLVVDVVGTVAGTVHLDRRQIIHARAEGVPTARDRLLGSGRITAADWPEESPDPLADLEVGPRLVARGVLDADTWQEVRRSAIIDAVAALIRPALTTGGPPTAGAALPRTLPPTALSDGASRDEALDVEAVIATALGRPTQRDRWDPPPGPGPGPGQRPPAAAGEALPVDEPSTPAEPRVKNGLTRRRRGAGLQRIAMLDVGPPREWADDLTATVEVDPRLITRLIDGMRRLG